MLPHLFTVSYCLFCYLPFLFNLHPTASVFQSKNLLRKVWLWQVASTYFRRALWSKIKMYTWTLYWEASSVAACACPMLQQRAVSLLPVWGPFWFWREARNRTFCRNLITDKTLLTGWFHEEWESKKSGGVILQQWGQLCRPFLWRK